MSPTNSGAGEAIVTLEAHELQTLMGSGIIKPLNELEALPLNFDRAFRHDNDNHRLSGEKAIDINPSSTSTNGISDLIPDDIVVTLESYDLSDLTGSSLLKPLNELEALPLNFDRALRHVDETSKLTDLSVVNISKKPSLIASINGTNPDQLESIDIPMK